MATRLRVVAGASLLEGYVRTPLVGLSELIWNALDEDAERVDVRYDLNTLGSIDRIHVDDDGSGMTSGSAERAFTNVGNSWKRTPGATTSNGRTVHGRHGRGRYAAFSLGEMVTWNTVAEAPEGGRRRLIVAGTRSDIEYFDVSDADATDDPAGTRVTILNPPLDAQRVLLDEDAVRTDLITRFALHLQRYPSIEATWQGVKLDPSSVQKSREEISVETPEDVDGEISMTIVTWNLKNVQRRIYLCDSTGAVIGDVPARVQAPGAEFSVYLKWDGFRDNPHDLMLVEQNQTTASLVLDAGKAALKKFLKSEAEARRREVIQKWKREKVYPYDDVKPKNATQTAERQAFDIVALAAAPVINQSKEAASKRLSLSLIREALETNPQSIQRILSEVLSLPPDRIEELRVLLDRTTLSSVIASSKRIADRLDFLHGLNALIFDQDLRKSTLERRQLHRILARETWLFGEEWALTGDDQRLIEVLKTHLSLLGEDVELADPSSVKRVDGRDAIPDLVLSQGFDSGKNQLEYLVVELKRPSHKLTGADVEQIRSYAGAITRNERFNQPNVRWEFWLVGNAADSDVDEQRDQLNLPFGVVTATRKYSIFVKTWTEVIGDAEHRLKFVQSSLDFTSSHDEGIRYMQEKHSEFLPESIAIESDEAQFVSESV